MSTRTLPFPLVNRQHRHKFVEQTMAMSPLGSVVILECRCTLQIAYEYLGQTLFEIVDRSV